MPRGTTLRNIRVDDELWTAALSTAVLRGENLSEVIRRALREYITEGAVMTPRRIVHPAPPTFPLQPPVGS